eukprot:362574-Prymnesium_polylepis.1
MDGSTRREPSVNARKLESLDVSCVVGYWVLGALAAHKEAVRVEVHEDEREHPPRQLGVNGALGEPARGEADSLGLRDPLLGALDVDRLQLAEQLKQRAAARRKRPVARPGGPLWATRAVTRAARSRGCLRVAKPGSPLWARRAAQGARLAARPLAPGARTGRPSDGQSARPAPP